MRRIRFLFLVAAGIFVLVTLYFYVYLQPAMVFDKTRWVNMQLLANTVAKYNGKYGKLPASLEDVVDVGIAPKTSFIYFCPLAHDTFFEKAVDYKSCEFEIICEQQRVIIGIPEKDYLSRKSSFRYKWLLPERRVLVVTRDMTSSE